MDTNERMNMSLFTLNFSVKEIREINKLLGERNAALMAKVNAYAALPLPDEKEVEAICEEVRIIESSLEKINHETERIFNIVKEIMGE